MLDQVDGFYKASSILQVPQDLLQEVQEWVVGKIAYKILREVQMELDLMPEDAPRRKSFIMLETKLNQLSSFEDSSSIYGKIFTLSSDQIPYTANLEPIAKVKFLVVVDRYIKNSNGNWQGREPSSTEKEPFIGKMTIYYLIPEYSEIDEYFKQVKRTVRHEIQHVVQAATTHFKKLKYVAGLPSHHIRNLDIHPAGYDPSTGQRVEHSFRDVEFYPRISDAVDLFNQYKKYIPLSLHKKMADFIVGEEGSSRFTGELYSVPNLNKDQLQLIEKIIRKVVDSQAAKFFRKLKFEHDSKIEVENQWAKEHNPDVKMKKSKWQKAVKEFTKAIGYIE